MPKVNRFLSTSEEMTYLALRAIGSAFLPPYEWAELLQQLEPIGARSVPLIAAAGFALGIVLTLHTHDTLVKFGAVALSPTLQAASFFTELGPLLTALLIQSRNLPAKLDDTMVNARDASQQINQVSHTVNATITDALAPDQSGVSAAENLRDTLSNVNRTTGNLADDTEALKHEFFFRGFFKKRGFYSLDDLTPESYRNNTYFQNPLNRRFWIEGAEAFSRKPDGSEALSDVGQDQIDRVVGSVKDSIVMSPIIVEGYSDDADPAKEITRSAQRALLVDHYLVQHFHLHSRDIGFVSLNAKPPRSSGKDVWGRRANRPSSPTKAVIRMPSAC